MEAPVYRQSGWESPGNSWLLLSIGFGLLVHLWETYLDYRQHIRLKVSGAEVPVELKKLVERMDSDEEKLLEKLTEKGPKAQAYALAKSRFKFVNSSFQLILSIATTILGLSPYAWDLASGYGAKWFGGSPESREIKDSLLFMGVITVFETITTLPFDYYSTFVIEQKHGFNKSTVRLFITDKIKSLLLTALIGGPIVAALLSIVRAVGAQNLALYVGVFVFCISLLLLTIFPVVIQPLFNKYEPLEAGELKSAIEALAESVKYPLYKLFTVDGSKRSNHSNAYMYGFFKAKRIVLFDTLLKQASSEEIVAILAHELGHWSHGHTLLAFAVTQTYFFASFYFFSRAMAAVDMYRSFGFRAIRGTKSPTAGAPIIVGLMLFFSTLWTPVDHTLNFLLTLNSRRMEYQADQYAVALNKADALARGLVKITFENLGILDPDPWYSTYHHSHPPLVHRLRAISIAQESTSNKKLD
uniref:CAAX prenyl protease n=1 Tax=Aureoumbra lagunensis TaxID=44058 RepID=A0A6S8ENZ2_9STRA